MGMLLGVKEVKIFVPRGLDGSIIESIEGEGESVEVVVVEGCYDDSVGVAHRWGEENEGGMLIEGTAFEGYEDVPKVIFPVVLSSLACLIEALWSKSELSCEQWTVQGYRSMLYEIDSQLDGQAPNLIAAPVGVGSLAQAIVAHYKSPKSLSPSLSPPSTPNRNPTAILTVEPHAAASLHTSLQADSSLTITTSPTIMTGLECGTISTAAWPILRDGVDASVTVGDWEVHEAVGELERYGVMAGPCGAAALAGLRAILRRRAEDEKGIEKKRLREVTEVLELGEESVVVLVCTEGRRAYVVPKESK